MEVDAEAGVADDPTRAARDADDETAGTEPGVCTFMLAVVLTLSLRSRLTSLDRRSRRSL